MPNKIIWTNKEFKIKVSRETIKKVQQWKKEINKELNESHCLSNV